MIKLIKHCYDNSDKYMINAMTGVFTFSHPESIVKTNSHFLLP